MPSQEGVDPVPTRAFRVSDSTVLERVPRGGIGCFVLKGWNVCRPFEDMVDFRMTWGFSGEEGKVKEMVEKMKLFVPSVEYDRWWSLKGYV